MSKDNRQVMLEALEALDNHTAGYKLTPAECCDIDLAIAALSAAIEAQPAKREGCDYIVAAGKLCRKCGSVHQPGR